MHLIIHPLMLRVFAILSLAAAGAFAQESAPAEEEPLPTIFLDKNPRIIAYQLARLSNGQIVRLERKDTDPKYKPIYEAILTRPGLEAKYRIESLNALVKLNKSDAATELIAAITKVDEDTDEQKQAAREAHLRDLSSQLIRQKPATLAARQEELSALASDANAELTRAIAYAASLTGSGVDATWQMATEKDSGVRLLMQSVALVREPKVLTALRPRIIETINETRDNAVRGASAGALSYVPGGETESAALLTSLILQDKNTLAAILSLSRIPSKHYPKDKLGDLSTSLVNLLESIPTDDRTSPQAIDALQFGQELVRALPDTEGTALRKKLRSLGVQVVLLKAPLEQMIYDQRWVAVEAGKPVQIVFENTDAMPHNFVLVKQGAVAEVGMLAEKMEPSTDPDVLQYVPKSDKILHAMQLVQAGETGRLSFTAPSEPGEYPYVCTFPGHWRRMYGVLVVVKDLDAFMKAPIEPADPLGITRKLVKEWTIDDFKPHLASLDKRDAASGKLIFTEAGCNLCHRVGGKGGLVGPELDTIFMKYKNDRAEVLTHILDPSKVIDDKYRPYLMETIEGDKFTGLIVGEEDGKLLVITNPNNPVPRKMSKDDIIDQRKLSTSMMPAALLNMYTRDEILDLLKYLEAGGKVAPEGHDHKH